MRTLETARSQQFAADVQRLAAVLGHRGRHEPLRAYLTGCACPGTGRVSSPWPLGWTPGNVRSRHQSMHHFIADAPWDERAVLRVAQARVLARHSRARLRVVPLLPPMPSRRRA